MAAIVIAAAVGGRRVYPRDFVGHMLVGCLLIPLGAALLGTLPFLREPRLKTNGGRYCARQAFATDSKSLEIRR
jgi:hypothetical protein